MRLTLALLLALIATTASAVTLPDTREPQTAWERSVIDWARESQMFLKAEWSIFGTLLLVSKRPENFVNNAIVLPMVCEKARNGGRTGTGTIAISVFGPNGKAGDRFCVLGSNKWGAL